VKLASPAFAEGEPIPTRYTCDGDEVSPELHWFDVPDAAVMLALTCQDPDAPRGVFTHWLVWDLDPALEMIPGGEVPPEVQQGRNDFGKIGYGGPCPPHGHGPHRYFFTLHATHTTVALPNGAKAEEVFPAVSPITIATAQLIGTYER
jgi:Raf kinase inhibitor-like YbhB/YbcL family protein